MIQCDLRWMDGKPVDEAAYDARVRKAVLDRDPRFADYRFEAIHVENLVDVEQEQFVDTGRANWRVVATATQVASVTTTNLNLKSPGPRLGLFHFRHWRTRHGIRVLCGYL